MARGAIFGVVLGGVFVGVGVLGVALGRWLFDSGLAGVLVMQPMGLVFLGVLFWRVKPQMDRSQKEFLASTSWSKAQGLRADEIVLRGS